MDHGNDDRDKDTTSNSLCLMKHEEEHDVDAKMSDSNTVDSEGHSEAPLPVDSKCVAVTRCVAQSCDHRKVVSHIFGRYVTLSGLSISFSPHQRGRLVGKGTGGKGFGACPPPETSEPSPKEQF